MNDIKEVSRIIDDIKTNIVTRSKTLNTGIQEIKSENTNAMAKQTEEQRKAFEEFKKNRKTVPTKPETVKEEVKEENKEVKTDLNDLFVR